jgi:hypothetical protein
MNYLFLTKPVKKNKPENKNSRLLVSCKYQIALKGPARLGAWP